MVTLVMCLHCKLLFEGIPFPNICPKCNTEAKIVATYPEIKDEETDSKRQVPEEAFRNY